MQCAFREMKFLVWLASRGELSPDQVVQVLARQTAGHRPIGRIALRRRMLSMEQIQEILHYQADHGGLFGTIAHEQGMLSGQQLRELLALQSRAIPSLDTVLQELGLIDAGRLERLKLEAVYTSAPDVDDRFVQSCQVEDMVGKAAG